MTKKTNSWLPIIVCSLASFFYIYEFTVRIAPAAMVDELMSSFNIRATGFSLLAAMFFYGYAPLQVPAGLLYDKVGPRLLLSVATFLCALATIAFGFTDNIAIAYICRLTMGITAAFAFIGALLVASRWFPPRHFALFAGIVQFMGCIGAIVGLAPIAALSSAIGWRSATFWMAAVGILFSILMWTIIRDYPPGAKPLRHNDEDHFLARLNEVCNRKQTWWVALYSLTCWAPIDIFASVWGTPFLENLYNISSTEAAVYVSVIWMGIAIGSPLAGWWSSHIHKRGLPMLVCSIIGLASSTIIIYAGDLSHWVMCGTLFLLGVSASSQVVAFGVVLDNNRDEVMGTAVGFNNMAVIFGGVTLQPLVGVILEKVWNHQMVNKIPYYSISEFHTALAMIPVVCIVGILVSIIFIKETNCKRKYPIARSTMGISRDINMPTILS